MDISSQRRIAVYIALKTGKCCWLVFTIFPAYVHKKKKKLTKGDQARTKVGFQLFDYSSH